MKKTIVYTNTQETNENIIFGIFPNFDCYIRFQFECGCLAKVTLKEKTGDGRSISTEISRIVFGTEIQDFFAAIRNYIKANDYSLYLLNTSSDETKFIACNIFSDVDYCYISPSYRITLIEQSVCQNPDRLLLEHVVVRKDNIKIELYPNENLGYEEPHVHVLVNNDKAYKISLLDSHSILKVYKATNTKTEKMIISLIKNNIVKLRNRWNDFSNKIKFVTDENGNATSKTKKL